MHDHDDDSLNFPFHHHYERQKLGLDEAPEGITLPPYILQVAEGESVSEKADPACPFVYCHVALDGDEKPVLKGTAILLEETLEYLIDQTIGAIIHFSPVENEERLTVGAALDEISRVWDEDCPPLVIASHLPLCLSTVQEIMPSVPQALFLEDWMKETAFAQLPELIETLSPQALMVDEHGLSETTMEGLLDTELPLAIITGDNQLQAKRLQSWGADTLVSDAAVILQENLG